MRMEILGVILLCSCGPVSAVVKVPLSDADTDTDGDSDTDVDADADVDTDTDVDVNVLDCDLADMWQLDDVDELREAMWRLPMEQVSFHTDFLDEIFSLADDTCPEIVEAGDQNVTIRGGCETEDGWAYKGRLAAVWGPQRLNVRYRDFELIGHNDRSQIDFFADGRFTLQNDGSGLTADISLTQWADFEGEWKNRTVQGLVHREHHYERASDRLQVSGSLELLEVWEGRTGAFCFDLELQPSACDEEMDGRLLLQGGVGATVTMNGSEDCDGCFETNIAGVDSDPICP